MKNFLKLFFEKLKKELHPDKLNQRLTILSSLLLKAGVCLIICFMVFILVSGLLDKRYILQPFHVTAGFQEQGYDGIVISNAILDKMNEITNTPILLKKNHSETAHEEEILDGEEHKSLEGVFEMEVPGVGINLNNIIGAMKQATGIKKNTISGELTRIDSILFLNIRISGYPSVKFEEKIDKLAGLRGAYDNLIGRAAEHSLKKIKPVKYLYYAYYSKQYEEATSMANQMLREESGNKRRSAYNVLGLIAKKRKDYKLAEQLFQKAIEEDPEFSVAYNSLGTCLADQKKYEEAFKAYEKAIEINPDNATAFFNWGLPLSEKSDYKGAL
jgi:tetratricopeptide (TPR) repeat protein